MTESNRAENLRTELTDDQLDTATGGNTLSREGELTPPAPPAGPVPIPYPVSDGSKNMM